MISVTSASKSRFTSSGCVLLTRILGPFGVFFTSYNQFFEKEKDVVTGIVQRYIGRNISINLGKADAVLNEAEQVKGEEFKPTERIKVYILEVKNGSSAGSHSWHSVSQCARTPLI